MPKQYLVNEHPEWFIDALSNIQEPNSRYISYRMLICHAIHKNKNFNQDQIRNFLQRISIDLENDNVEEFNDFFTTYPIKNTNHGDMVVVIDRTEGSYPLILHNLDKMGDITLSSGRISEFRMALDEINTRFDEFFEILNRDDNFGNLIEDLKEIISQR